MHVGSSGELLALQTRRIMAYLASEQPQAKSGNLDWELNHPDRDSVPAVAAQTERQMYRERSILLV